MGVENEWRLGRRGRGWRGERGGGEEGRCHKEGGARETSATCVGDGDGGGGEGGGYGGGEATRSYDTCEGGGGEG